VDDLQWSVRDGVGTIRLNRPDSRNAFTFEMIHEWVMRGPTTRSA
jgi:enoyl-CoA hydratase/carnithine racemase